MIKTPNKLLLTAMVLAAGLSISAEANAFPWKSKKKKAETAVKTETPKETKYYKLFKEDHEVEEGLFKIHKIKGKVYFEVADSLLGREMLLGTTIVSTSDNGFGIVGSKPVKPMHFMFTKESDNIAMRIVSEKVIAPADSPAIASALRSGSTGAIYKLFKIETISPDSSASVIDMTDLFLSHDKYLSPFDQRGLNTGMGRYKMSETFSKDKSSVETIKSFADNSSVSSSLTYSVTVTDRGASYKDVPVTVKANRSILLLGKEAYQPRRTDSRIGIFPTQKTKFTGETTGTQTIYYANRWQIEPADAEAWKRGELTEPTKPIIFYIDNNFPENWLPHIMEGVEQWSEVFEKIGFKNAVRAELFPSDDPEFDPDNLKYSCVRYAPIAISNAMGPSWVDPRSGEIVSASVYIYHDVTKLINNWLLIQTSPADPRVRHKNIPADVFGDALRYVTAHEIGHCLGFMHNMSASSVIPTDSLRSASYTRQQGTTTSIMDYARFNYVAQPEDAGKGVKMTPPRFGQYDEYLVRWLYTPLFCDDVDQAYEITSGWLAEASQDPMYRYGKQQNKVIDPKSQSEDLGDDAVLASTYGIRNLKYILANLDEWVGEEDTDYTYRRSTYNNIVSQYSRYLSHVYANVGGIYMNEKHVGDFTTAAEAVPEQKQRDALRFIFAQLDDIDWLDDTPITNNIGLIGSAADVMAEQIMKVVVNAPAKIAASEAMTDMPYISSRCAKDVFDYVWAQAKSGQALSPRQMKLQRMHLQNAGEQAGIQVGPAATKSIVDTDPYAISCDLSDVHASACSCCGAYSGSHGGEFDPVAGYGAPSATYSTKKSMEITGYGYMMEAKKLIERNRNHADTDTRLHYRSLLLDIEKGLKNK